MSQNPNNSDEPNQQDNIEKVRDILFGSNLRELDQQLDRMKERISGDLDNHRRDLLDRLSTLELFFKQEIKTVIEKIENEQQVRSKTNSDLYDTFNELSAKMDNSLREIHEQILARTNNLHDEIHDIQRNLTAEIIKDLHTLDLAKVSRTDLAKFLNEWIGRLSSTEEVKH